MDWWESDEKCFWPFKPFSKLKATICKYWTLVKIKVDMTCACKEYEVKLKILQEQWLQLQLKFFWFITRKLLFSGWINLWWRQCRWSNFWNKKYTQMNLQNLFNDWKATANFIRKWFKKASPVNENTYLL